MAQTSSECPVCGGEIRLMQDPLAGELLDCHTCGAELEVTSPKPLSLSEAPQAAEDWGE